MQGPDPPLDPRTACPYFQNPTPKRHFLLSYILAIILLQHRRPNARFIDDTKSYYNEKSTTKSTVLKQGLKKDLFIRGSNSETGALFNSECTNGKRLADSYPTLQQTTCKCKL